jgi:hypothetical protein
MIREVIDLGDTVVCDTCNKDYTFSEDIGGILFGSNACCPTCTERMMPDIIRYGEESYTKAKAGPNESFRGFVLRHRNGDNTIRIISWGPEEQDDDPPLYRVTMLPGHEGDVRGEPFYVELYAANEDDAREQAGRKHYFATVENVERV